MHTVSDRASQRIHNINWALFCLLMMLRFSFPILHNTDNVIITKARTNSAGFNTQAGRLIPPNKG